VERAVVIPTMARVENDQEISMRHAGEGGPEEKGNAR
jgi:hypothetical protein